MLPAPRAPVRLVVDLTFKGSGAKAKGVTHNISETGVLVRTSRAAPRGAHVQLKFKEFEATAEVIWPKRNDEEILLGMKFLSLGRRGHVVVRGLVTVEEQDGPEGYSAQERGA